MPVIIAVISPDPDGIVIADRNQNTKDWVPLDHLHVLSVPLQHGYTLVLVPWLHLPYPHSLVPAARREQRTGLAPRHALHLIIMPLQCGDALEVPAGVLPNRGGAIETRGRQQLPVGGPGAGPHRALVHAVEHIRAVPDAVGGALPDAHGLVAAAGGEDGARAGARVGVPGERPGAVGVARQAVGLAQLRRAAVHGLLAGDRRCLPRVPGASRR